MPHWQQNYSDLIPLPQLPESCGHRHAPPHMMSVSVMMFLTFNHIMLKKKKKLQREAE